jgi:hypothetical protein
MVQIGGLLQPEKRGVVVILLVVKAPRFALETIEHYKKAIKENKNKKHTQSLTKK